MKNEMNKKDATCPLCDRKQDKPFFSSKLKWAVRSDCRVVPASISIYLCRDCHHLFKAEEDVLKWSDYGSGYNAWNCSSEMDKMDFADKAASTRSSLVLSYLKRMGFYTPSRTQILDYGCNRGAFLRLLDGKHSGFDVSEHYREVVSKVGHRYFTPQDLPPQRSFDVLTLIHVFEHLSRLSEDMSIGLSSLKGEGVGLFQVPYSCAQPSDFYVVDHRSHFSPASLHRGLSKVGLYPVDRIRCVVSGELTGLYSFRTRDVDTRYPPIDFEALKVTLEAGEESLCQIQRNGEPCLVYGAGLLGALVSMFLGEQVEGFIDDNPGFQGQKINGKEVRTYQNWNLKGRKTVIAVPPPVAQKVLARCQSVGIPAEPTYSPVPGLQFPFVAEVQ